MTYPHWQVTLTFPSGGVMVTGTNAPDRWTARGRVAALVMDVIERMFDQGEVQLDDEMIPAHDERAARIVICVICRHGWIEPLTGPGCTCEDNSGWYLYPSTNPYDEEGEVIDRNL